MSEPRCYCSGSHIRDADGRCPECGSIELPDIWYNLRWLGDPLASLELGLRWLHDRASRCGCGYIHDTWCTNPVLGPRGPLAALELGLRWLSDRAEEDACESPRWRHSSKELPPENEAILLWYGDKCKIGWYINCGSRQDDYWLFDSCAHRFDEVSHWMPLPEAPK